MGSGEEPAGRSMVGDPGETAAPDKPHWGGSAWTPVTGHDAEGSGRLLLVPDAKIG